MGVGCWVLSEGCLLLGVCWWVMDVWCLIKFISKSDDVIHYFKGFIWAGNFSYIPYPSLHIRPILSIHYKIPLRNVIKHNLQVFYKFAEFGDKSFVFSRFAVHEKVGFADAKTDFT